MTQVRELAVYDGRDCLGKIAVTADGQACAFDLRGKLLGTFESAKAAYAAFASTRTKAAGRS
jgi:hypothetical protein